MKKQKRPTKISSNPSPLISSINGRGSMRGEGFTLVELIVVIVILAILATIAFLSFSSQSASARDSTRLADMSNIAKGLSVFKAIGGTYPKPDKSVSISGSGIIMTYQGYAGSNVLNMIKLSSGGKDPLDNSTYYTYATSGNQGKFQLLGFLEDGTNSALSLLPLRPHGENWSEANADSTSYSGRYAVTKGDLVGILLNNSTLMPIQSSNAPVDLINTNSGTSYKAIFGNENSINNIISNGDIVFSNMLTRNEDATADKSLAALDSTLVGFWDMETLSGTMLKDLSKYGNNGTCYNSGTPVDCKNLIVSGNGKTGKAMMFDGIDDGAVIPHSASLDISGNITMLAFVRPNNLNMNHRHRIISKYPDNTGIAGGYSLSIRDRVAHLETPFEPWLNIGGTWNNAIQYKSITNLIESGYYLIANTYDGSWNKMYLNGSKENSYQTSGNIGTNTNNLYIAKRKENVEFASATIDEIRIYNRALSEQEIQSIYSSLR